LAPEDRKNTIDSQLQRRLDDLFREEDTPPPADEPGARELTAGYPLGELKNLILSIDWEITDDALSELLAQIRVLKTTFENDRIVVMFLQMLGSLGDYIKTYRAKAHPQTFRILNSIFARLDQVVVTDGMTESEKKRILRAELDKYNELRRIIAQKLALSGGEKPTKSLRPTPGQADKKQRAIDTVATSQTSEPAVTERAVTEPGVAEPAVTERAFTEPAVAEPAVAEPATASANEMRDALAGVVEELKAFIRGEIQSLREELLSLAKSDKP
jgi:hypothetical protein